MSKISDDIRSYIEGPEVSRPYGQWGNFSLRQRRLIRKLCDTCDMFEETADTLAKKQFEAPTVEVELKAEKIRSAHYKALYEASKKETEDIFERIISALKHTEFASPLAKNGTLAFIYSLRNRHI